MCTGRYRPNTLIGPVVLGLGELMLWRRDRALTESPHRALDVDSKNVAEPGVDAGEL